jgi:hypothetical protein
MGMVWGETPQLASNMTDRAGATQRAAGLKDLVVINFSLIQESEIRFHMATVTGPLKNRLAG